jgi:hypothetical protein
MATIEEQIEKLRKDTQEKLDKEIKKLELSAKVNDARKTLATKIKNEKLELEKNQKLEIKAFELEYSATFDITKPKPLTIEEKCIIASKETNDDGTLKYTLSENGKFIIGSKGQPINTIISFYKDEEAKKNKDKKETLSVNSYLSYFQKEINSDTTNK